MVRNWERSGWSRRRCGWTWTTRVGSCGKLDDPGGARPAILFQRNSNGQRGRFGNKNQPEWKNYVFGMIFLEGKVKKTNSVGPKQTPTPLVISESLRSFWCGVSDPRKWNMMESRVKKNWEWKKNGRGKRPERRNEEKKSEDLRLPLYWAAHYCTCDRRGRPRLFQWYTGNKNGNKMRWPPLREWKE